MKRVIRFSRVRYWFFALSLSMFLAGAIAYVLNGGFNLGVDFKAGISLQFQVAPASFSLVYEGPDKAELSIPAGEQALTAAGDFIITVSKLDGTKQANPFRFTDYTTIRDFTAAVAKVEGVRATIKGDPNASPKSLIPLVRTADITRSSYTINISPETEKKTPIAIADIRDALAPMGDVNLQTVGSKGNQEFIARKEAPTVPPADFQTNTEQALVKCLGDKFGADQIILKSTNFVGPRLSQALAVQSVWLIIIALLCILGYLSFRFKFVYALSGVLGIAHDALFIMAFAAVFRVEFDAGAIAAILTILGYSINDTIVIFDRVRENKSLMHDADPLLILDTSVSQTIGRTFITAISALLTVVSLFVLTTGTMKTFSLLLLVGTIEGTYSTFISNFMVCEWEVFSTKRRKRLDRTKYGIKEKVVQVEEKPAEEVAADAQADSVMQAGDVLGLASPGADAGVPEPGTPADAGQETVTQPKPAAKPQIGHLSRPKYHKKKKEQ